MKFKPEEGTVEMFLIFESIDYSVNTFVFEVFGL